MDKIKNLVLVTLILLAYNGNAQWFSLNKSLGETPQKPQVRLLKSDNNETIVKIELSGFELNHKTIEGTEYDVIGLLTGVNTTEVGAPTLPVISEIIAIPDSASVSVEVVKIGETSLYSDIDLPASQKSLYEGTRATTFAKNEAIYNTDVLYPTTIAELGEPAVFRDFRITRLVVSPIRYNPVKKELEVISSITVKLKYDNEKTAINPKTASKRAIAPSFAKLYKNSILNYEDVVQTQYSTLDEGHDLMLCIVPDELYEDFVPYANWKRKTGIDIHITKFSDIGATSSNPITIKNHITDAYHNWIIPPTHVLLVGDDGVFPTKTISYDYSFVYDDYFVEIDGDDFFPEMMVGRFTNQGNYRMKVMMNKFTLYEKEPYTEETDWFKKGICCSNNYVESQVTTKEYTRGLMLDYGFTSVDAMMSSEICEYDVADVISAINEGRSYLNYRGEGWTSGWWASCTPFQNDDLDAVNNGEKFTFFTSIGCGVAMFDAGSGNCFGENLVQMGTISHPKGAIAFVGPTSNTHTTYNNKIDKGIYKGMFIEDMETPGEALLRGKMYMYAVHGDATFDGYNGSEYHFRIYHVLGDPSIHIWKEVPLAINVNHTDFVTVGDHNITATVTYQETGLPVNEAQVTLTDDNGLFVTGYTDETGTVTLTATIPEEESFNLSVRGKDVIPYLGSINVYGLGVNDLAQHGIELSSSPNPFIFGDTATISYAISEKSQVSLSIFNTRGQLVSKLENNTKSAGVYTVQWNGLSDANTALESGIYYCQLRTDTATESIKLIMIK